MKSKLFFTCGLWLALTVLVGVVAAQKTENICNQDAFSGERLVEAVSAPANVVQLVDFSGQGSDEVFPSNEIWQPFGPYRTIRVGDKQKIVGFGSAVFGLRSGTARIAVGLCYAKNESKDLTAFAGNDHLLADADASRRTFAVSASGALPAGTYSVGYCVINRGSQPLDNNDYVNGWILVTN